MSNFTLVDPKGWDCDLQSVCSILVITTSGSNRWRCITGLLRVHGILPAPQYSVVSNSELCSNGRFQSFFDRRYERSWGALFETFDEFLTFSWPTIVVTDTWTGRAHIVVRMSTVGAFLKMLKTRYADDCLRSAADILTITAPPQVRGNPAHGREHPADNPV